jgi:hypothetical protein
VDSCLFCSPRRPFFFCGRASSVPKDRSSSLCWGGSDGSGESLVSAV